MTAALLGQYMVWAVLAGLLGALAMVGVLWAFTQSGLANVRLITAIGSLVTRKYENAIPVGCLMHAAAGIVFAMLYAFFLHAINAPGFGANLAWGGVIGFLHGLLMSLVLLSAVAEVHPLPEFQKRGFTIVVADWVAHLVYGMVVGAVFGVSGLIPAPQ